MTATEARGCLLAGSWLTLVTPGTGANRALRAALAAVAVWTSATSTAGLLQSYPRAVDLEIPLRAVERWLAGGHPYLASSFQVTYGAGQPFLYPPFVLPLLAPFAGLPHAVIVGGWAAVCLAAAVWACARLGMPAWWLLPVLLWPPFAQPLLGLNVQVVLFALFVTLLWERPRWGARRGTGPGEARASASLPTGAGSALSGPLAPVDRDLERSTRTLPDGLLAVGVAILKTSQVQPWLHLLRRRPRAAIAGALLAGLLVVATVPFTGVGLWGSWFDQVRHAAGPGAIGGISFARLVPAPFGLLVEGAAVVLALAVPRRHAGAWLGLLLILGSPNLHYFGLLFAIPALLLVRREFALLAAASIGLYTTAGAWIGVAIVAGTLALATRFEALLEPA